MMNTHSNRLFTKARQRTLLVVSFSAAVLGSLMACVVPYGDAQGWARTQQQQQPEGEETEPQEQLPSPQPHQQQQPHRQQRPHQPAPTPQAQSGQCQAPNNAGRADAQLESLLTRTAWCSFTYKNGVTKQGRAVFGRDGIASYREGRESSHSGKINNQYGDTTATWGAGGASRSADQACWKLEGRTLMLSVDGTNYANSTRIDVTYNSNGYPILKTQQGEFMVCN